MPFKGWFGIAETARQFKKIDIGVANVARKVKAIWIGDENNLARKIIFLSISAPSSLRVNGLTSDSDSTCTLTWTAATITGAAGITYYIYRNGVQAATTTSTSYTFTTSAISSWSNVTLTVKAYNETTGFSSASNAVTFTYVQPVTLTAPPAPAIPSRKARSQAGAARPSRFAPITAAQGTARIPAPSPLPTGPPASISRLRPANMLQATTALLQTPADRAAPWAGLRPAALSERR